jgi:hypothetical protein
MPTNVKTLIETPNGSLAANDGMVYFLTPCCGATATGTEDGTACRGCYTLIDDYYGAAVSVSDRDAVRRVAVMLAWLTGGPADESVAAALIPAPAVGPVCGRCGDRVPLLRQDGWSANTDRGLTVEFTGSYGEFVDTVYGEPEAVELCHACGHALMKWIGLDVSSWHSDGPAVG